MAERIPTPLSFAASDVLITASFGFLLPEALLDIVPPRHAINIHPSLLPKYRGAAPIQWAIANGETQSGVTVQTLSRGKFDQGLVLDQRAVVSTNCRLRCLTSPEAAIPLRTCPRKRPSLTRCRRLQKKVWKVSSLCSTISKSAKIEPNHKKERPHRLTRYRRTD